MEGLVHGGAYFRNFTVFYRIAASTNLVLKALTRRTIISDYR